MVSIRWKLVASYVLVALLATFVVGALSLSIVNSYFIREERAALLRSAQVAAEDVVAFLWPEPDVDRLRSVAVSYSFLGQTRMVVLDTAGEALVDSGPHPWAPPESDCGMVVTETMLIQPSEGILFRYAPSLFRVPFGEPEGVLQVSSFVRVPIPAPSAGETRGFATLTQWSTSCTSSGSSFGHRSSVRVSDIQVMAPVAGPDGSVIGYVELSERPNYRAGTLDSIRRALIWAGLVAVALASVLGLGIGRSFTTPLVRLASAARRMGTGDLGFRANVRRDDEIGDVAQQFNSMAERLEESFRALAADRDALQRFAADAAHELRTPITALRTFNELLIEKAELDAEIRRDFLAESQDQIVRLDWLTKNLLDLSKLDAGMLELNLAEDDLARLAQKVTLSFLPQAERLGVTLRAAIPEEPILVTLDGARMEQVLANLLSNALKFTPRGGSVTVGLAPGSGEVELWVEDTGVGIPAEELAHIFDRFYRGQQGQTRGGSGLGLSIVKGIVEAHGGHVLAECLQRQGTRVTLKLPSTPDGQS